MAHRRRPRFERRAPVHVTLRVCEHVWSLRSRRSLRVLALAIGAAGDRFGARIVQFTILGNHIHLLVEAESTAALVRGMKGLSIRIAKGMNGLMGTKGRVLSDRYHSRMLRTPTEVRNAVNYIRHNYRHHFPGELPKDWVDPFSSSSPELVSLVGPARTWLARHPDRDRHPGV